MEFVQKRPSLAVLVGVVVGFFLGLMWGWFIDPIEWQDASPNLLHPDDQKTFLTLIADNYAVRGDAQAVQNALRAWPEANTAICQLAGQSLDPNERAKFEAIAVANTGTGCTATAPITPGETPATQPAEEEGGGLGSLIFFFLLFIVLVVAIVYVWRRRGAAISSGSQPRPTYNQVPEVGPVTGGMDDGVTAVPIARFRTTYTRGHDAYDDSFSIENASGDFLGECGVGISESIGADSPKNVTAFEVWLFDKNDIRTITKVVMSDHAFFDEAIRAKLATKGEQVLSRQNETIVLETASLIINAEIADMQYGTGTLPPQSYFETMTFELSAWAKEGDAAPTGNSNADSMMNF